ncbi:MAG TPA: NAD-dependent deacylase [Thermoanaerobaculia bacterium]
MIDEAVSWIESSRPTRIAILTGAGISAESGIPTFRGAGGLWENHRSEELATPEAFRRDPALVWRWYEWRRDLVRGAAPNAAHAALATLERKLDAKGRVTIVTQNVDGLHRRAGSRNVVELHGNLFRARCTAEGKTLPLPEPCQTIPPTCECGNVLRPDVVWFGELLPDEAMQSAIEAVATADLLLIVGTSGVVYPAAGLLSMLRSGHSIEINPERTPLSLQCDFSIQSSAAAATPTLCDAILRSAS